MTKYISVYLHSGLGNRLFQWAAAAHQASQTGRTLVVIDSFVGPNVHDADLHNYFLHMVRPLRKTKAWGTINFFTGQFDKTKLAKSTADTVILIGYFFDAKYAECLEELVRPYIREVVQQKTFRWTHSMVHVRLNDYRNALNLFNAQSTPMQLYQKRAFAFLNDNSDVQPLPSVFEVYSDEPEKALSWLPKPMHSLCRVMPKMPLRETFESMITCNGGICANSTFSWWAAMFQQWTLKEVPHFQWSPWTVQTMRPLLMPKPWARLQDLARLTAPISRSHPVTDAIQPKFAQLIEQPQQNWTPLELSVIGLGCLLVSFVFRKLSSC